MRHFIPFKIKKTCVELKQSGKSNSEIYEEYFRPLFEDPVSKRNFVTLITRWERRLYPDDATLEGGTYEGFTAHGATVQVAASGEIVQAWIKQSVNDVDPEEFLKALQEHVEPYAFKPHISEESEDMLEIPLFDMHWGISFLDYYQPVLDEVLNLIHRKRWKKIAILFGQDFFHNDSIINGQTTKGTPVEKVDMIRAVREGQRFIYAIADESIECADDVKILYSAGNHDKSISWMFMQTLLERYGSDIVDDSLESRKVLTYGNSAIMVTHGDSKRAVPRNLAQIFPIKFPEEFSRASIREVHAGHLHHESDSDIFGVMVRRLSSGKQTDTYEDWGDFVGSQKRFMIFDWSLQKLRAIYYI